MKRLTGNLILRADESQNSVWRKVYSFNKKLEAVQVKED